MRRFSRLVRDIAAAATMLVLSPEANAQCVWTSTTNTISEACGQVGIGVTTPTAPLHIFKSAAGAMGPELKLENGGAAVGDIEAISFFSNGTGRAQIRSTVEYRSGAWPGTLEFWTGYGSLAERMRITGDGDVAIGLTAAPRKLSVANGIGIYGNAPNNTTASLTAFEMTNRGANGSSYGWLTYTAAVGGGFGVGPNGYEIWEYPNDATKHCCHQRFVIHASTTGMQPATPVVIDGYGLLQANVIRSMGDITAVGNISAGGVINAKYQDVAEWVPATSDMEPGTVVVLNPERNNEVMPSHSEYDTTVAGVVSSMPGIILGIAGESKEQIATTGRVKVRVDARIRAVAVGDLLVTSDTPGTAMRSEPMEIRGRMFHQPGTIIGKALEPLAAGEGEILVLLSLQ